MVAVVRLSFLKEELTITQSLHDNYLYGHGAFQAKRYEQLYYARTLCDGVAQDRLPMQYCESTDPDRLVPIVWSPDYFLITVSDDPGRDKCFICCQNGFIGYPVSKKIELSAKWSQLLKKG